MRKQIARRLLAALLSLTMAVGLTPSAFAQSGGDSGSGGVIWEEISSDSVTASPELREAEAPEENSPYADDETVRVSIVLEGEPTIAMFAAEDIAENEDAMAYREYLEEYQEAAAEYISEEALDGDDLDVVWNLTLAANIISANVEYGQIEDIEELDGIEEVIIEPCFSIQDSQTEANPQMSISTGYAGSGMTNTVIAWENGYRGQGMRIAVIDSGLDREHQSFDNDAFLHALEEDAEDDGVEVTDYHLLNADEIEGVLDQLNVSKKNPSAAASELYLNEKVPFAYNYVDNNYNTDHLSDNGGNSAYNHGSEVASVVAANRYLKRGDEYVSSMDEVYMTGNAPDAQLVIMKVYGQGGGAYESDYLSALEDAILLGCTAANISIGGYNGFAASSSASYQKIYDGLAETGMVVSVSSCNYGAWADGTSYGKLYSEDVNFQTGGEPGSYANAFTVANVVNNGSVGPQYLSANGVSFAYDDATDGNNKVLSTLNTSGGDGGTEYPYVFFTGYGSIDEYDDVDVEGKVVFVSRGGGYDEDSNGNAIGNYTTKAHNAIDLKNAAALIVYNNVSGSTAPINFGFDNLYTGTAPAVGITQAAGESIKAASTPMEGRDDVYTGTITIYSGDIMVNIDTTQDYLVIHESSSWGVPGDLTLKPEITAPGSYLWMANGRYIYNDKNYGGTDAYISSFGTSFSAPQIASIAALTQQYINSADLSQSGLTDRALIQSLLMSTAAPLKDGNGNYYSVMQQGAGLVDTAAATSADSYILMGADATASWQDGKVKAELGDDPGRTGVYSFTFTINNLDGEVHSYTLDADVFTQAVETDGWYTYLSNFTEKLSGAAATFEILGSNGSSSGLSYDFDGNSIVNLDDGNALLDYVTGNRSSLSHQENAEFGRGVVDSYSAHLFLNAMDAVTVPANGNVTIRATITLNQAEMADILHDRWNGAYVEAFVNVRAEPDAEGYEGTSHSIPVLAFYGNWSDPSMFDKNSYSESVYNEWWQYPYLYSENGEYSNYLTVSYAGGGSSYLGVNPFSGLVEKNGYVEGRSALNNQYGDKLGRWYFALIRNAAAGRVLITDAETGDVYLERTTGRSYNAYYDVWNYYWYNTFGNTNINWAGTDRNGSELPEGTTVKVTVSMAPELYVDAGGNVNWEALGEGASLSTTVTIDNTAPTITDVSFDGSTVTVTAQDNQYVAAAVLVSSDGRTVVNKATPSQETPDVPVSMSLSLAGGVGQTFLVQVYDYACNVRTYRITLEETLEPEQTYRGYEYSTNEWVSYTEGGAKSSVDKYVPQYGQSGSSSVTTGEYVNGYLYVYDNYYTYPNLYWLSVDNLTSGNYWRYIDGEENDIYYVQDMAYDSTSQTMYLTISGYDNWGYYGLATVSLNSGSYSFIMWPYNTYYAIAASNDGTLYGVAYDYDVDNGSYALYSINPTALDGYGAGETKLGNIGLADWAAWNGFQSMTWDSENRVLLLAANGFDYDDDWNAIESGSSALYTIQVNGTDDLTVEKKMDLEHPLVSLYTYTPDAVEDGSADVTGVTLSHSSLSLLVGGTAQLTATMVPSDANDNTVVWSSSDESVVRVRDDGLVAARSAGTAVITAKSVDNPSAFATCVVTVTTLKLDLQALVTKGDGTTEWVSFNTENLKDLHTVASFNEPLLNVAVTPGGEVYAIDYDSDAWVSSLYSIDENYHATLINDKLYSGSACYLFDFAYAPDVNGGMFIGLDYYGYLYPMTTAGNISNYVSTYYNSSVYVLALTYVGSYKSGNTTYDQFILIDSNGDVYLDSFSWRGSALKCSGPSSTYLGSTGYSSDFNQYNSALLATDSSGKQYLLWCPSGSGELVAMEIDLENGTLGSACSVGTFPDGVSVSGLMTADVHPSGTAQQVNQPELPQDAQSEAAENVGPVTQTAPAPSGIESEIEEEDSAETEPPVEPDEDSNADLDGDSEDIPEEEESNQTPDDMETVYESVTSDATGGSAVSVTDRTATVQIVLDAASTNGKVKVSYDASVLELADVTGYAVLNSHNDSTDGEVVLAYAYKDAAAAGTVVAELSFVSKNETCNTNVTLTTLEDGMEKPAESEQIVPIIIGSTDVPDTSDGPGTTPSDPDTTPSDPGTAPSNPGTTPSNPGTSSSSTGSTGWRPGNTSTTGSTSTSGGTSTSGNTSNQTDDSNIADNDTPLDYLPDVSKPAISINVPAAPALDKIPGILAPYIDLNSGSWYNEYAAYVIANGLMAGTASNLFSPDAALSRGMLVTILHRAAGLPAVSVASGFTDVASGKWYTDAVTWAVLNDLVNGYADGTFQPNADITRQELAVILWRLAKQMGMDVTSDSAVLLNFTDRDEIASWAAEAVAWAYQCGILGGYSDGGMAPTAGASRIEAAAMIARFLELVEKNR